MNTQKLLSESKEQIARLLHSIPWLGDVQIESFDGSIDLGYDLEARVSTSNGNEAILQIECKAFPRPSQFPCVSQFSQFRNEGNERSTQVPVLAAARISPRMAELCDEHGWGWFDLAGNCKISVPNLFHIERQGYTPVKINGPTEVNIGTAEAGRVIRSLLTNKDLSQKWTQRSLRDACSPGVSLGLVNKVVRYLKDQAYLTDGERGSGFKLHDPLGLLREWSQSYQFKDHIRHEYFSLERPSKLREKLVSYLNEKEAHCALAVFSAATEQAAHVRGELKLWLYMDDTFRRNFEKITESKKVDSGADVIVLVPQDPGVFTGAQRVAHDNMPMTHPVQTYIDLIQAGGRGQEGAEALLEQKIKPVWKTANLIF